MQNSMLSPSSATQALAASPHQGRPHFPSPPPLAFCPATGGAAAELMGVLQPSFKSRQNCHENCWFPPFLCVFQKQILFFGNFLCLVGQIFLYVCIYVHVCTYDVGVKDVFMVSRC